MHLWTDFGQQRSLDATRPANVLAGMCAIYAQPNYVRNDREVFACKNVDFSYASSSRRLLQLHAMPPRDPYSRNSDGRNITSADFQRGCVHLLL